MSWWTDGIFVTEAKRYVEVAQQRAEDYRLVIVSLTAQLARAERDYAWAQSLARQDEREYAALQRLFV